MATVNPNCFFSTHKISPPKKPSSLTPFSFSFSSSKFFTRSRNAHRLYPLINSIAEDREVVTEEISISNMNQDEQIGSELESNSLVDGIGSEGIDRFVGKAINASIVLGVGTLAVTRLLTIDHEYWHAIGLHKQVLYVPISCKVLFFNTFFLVSVVCRWFFKRILQCVEGKPLFEFDRTRLFRSGLVGFALHGSLSHFYYQFCEALIPSKDWWVVPAKIAFDQTAWAAVWNSIYFVALGLLRLESPANIFNELKATFLLMLTAGWKLWPFAHLITYGVIPVEQRLLWVDCVELIWVTILSTYSNEKSEARISDAVIDLRGPRYVQQVLVGSTYAHLCRIVLTDGQESLREVMKKDANMRRDEFICKVAILERGYAIVIAD
ncbi:Mpv17/PMP22 [Cynara cardunculus var. scolymus]|uniref:Mpv17/PMP22 n=1 Tax=Cynara cardunculus var. scolymus TaxID=59895 RepID=A0A103XTH0_CYNCS|nr:Mpv17/PMP22 [Cynara cardunculus var. scolymus]